MALVSHKLSRARDTDGNRRIALGGHGHRSCVIVLLPGASTLDSSDRVRRNNGSRIGIGDLSESQPTDPPSAVVRHLGFAAGDMVASSDEKPGSWIS